MYNVDAYDVDTLDDLICDECDSFDLMAKESDHEDGVIEYYCRDCRAEWVEYV